MFGKKNEYKVTVEKKPNAVVDFIVNLLIVLVCAPLAFGGIQALLGG